MFDNLLTTIKNKTNSLSDNLKSKTKKLSINFNAFKTKSNKTASNYYTVSHTEERDYLDNDYLSPRACSIGYGNQWPSITDNMSWNLYVPSTLDEHNIVDRFIKVITIDDEDVRIISICIYIYILYFSIDYT